MIQVYWRERRISFEGQERVGRNSEHLLDLLIGVERSNFRSHHWLSSKDFQWRILQTEMRPTENRSEKPAYGHNANFTCIGIRAWSLALRWQSVRISDMSISFPGFAFCRSASILWVTAISCRSFRERYLSSYLFQYAIVTGSLYSSMPQVIGKSLMAISWPW